MCNLIFVEFTLILKPVYYLKTVTIEENLNMYTIK